MSPILASSIIGLGLFLFGWFQIRKLRASRGWHSARGMIKEVSVERRQASDPDDSDTYVPVVKYAYGAGGRPYLGSRIRFDERAFPSARAARGFLAAYPVGRSLAVFYDPADPAQSVLERRNSSGWVLMITGGVIFVLAIAAGLK